MSPDSRWIAYNTGGDKLQIVAREPRSKPRTVVANKEYSWIDVNNWFPDGKSVLITAKKTDNTWELARVDIAAERITRLKSLEWRRPIRNRDQRGSPLGRDDFRAQVSPDGRYVAYSALAVNPSAPAGRGAVENSDDHIYVLAVDGSGETEVVKTAGMNADPIWTADGKRLLFLSDRSGSVGLWSLAVQNGKPVESGSASLVAPQVGNILPIAMRGASYVYRENLPQVQSMTILRAGRAAVDPSNEVSTDTFEGFAPSWSPDGKWIAFKRPRAPGQHAIVLRSLETGNERMYSNLVDAGTGLLTWFHDSQSLLNDANGGFYRFDVKSGEIKQLRQAGDPWSELGARLTPEQQAQGTPAQLAAALRRAQPHALSYDGQTLYGVNRGVVVAMDLRTGQERELFSRPAVGASITTLSMAASPDGRTLAVGWLQDPAGRQPTLHIGRLAVDGGGFRELHSQANPNGVAWNGVLRWTADSRTILFSQRQAEADPRWGIMRIAADGNSPASLVFQSRAEITGFDVNSDASRFVVVERKGVSRLVSLDNVLSLIK
jgi:dipeptidyl aminopeptidase/acylaminoacyl peptidase